MHSLFQPSFAFGGGACNVIGECTGVFFTVCDNLFKFVKKPTVAAQYSGGMMKRLLDLWWTGHLPTGSCHSKTLWQHCEFFFCHRPTMLK